MDSISTLSAGLVFRPGYAVAVLLGVAVALAFPITKDIGSAADRKRYYIIQGITLAGALAGAKLAVLMGDALWPLVPFEDWGALVFSGRSIIGALVVGFLVAEAAKPLLRYPLPPNDRFAVVLPFSIGIGRFGCYLVGCCRGVPHDGPLAISYADGIARHPIPLYEMSFHFLVGLTLLHLYRQGILRRRLFALYLVCYGVFRFSSEYLRVTEKVFTGLSAYQWFALLGVAAGLTAIALRSQSQTPPLANSRARA